MLRFVCAAQLGHYSTLTTKNNRQKFVSSDATVVENNGNRITTLHAQIYIHD